MSRLAERIAHAMRVHTQPHTATNASIIIRTQQLSR
jgi:hypothetical protein